MELTPAQRAAADAAMRALAARRPFLLIGAAGTGKTTTAVAFVASLAERRGVSPKQGAILKRIAAERLGKRDGISCSATD